jgi:hypothetical protein
VVSIGDVVKNIIRDLEHNVGDLMGYIMKDSPGADRRAAVPRAPSAILSSTIESRSPRWPSRRHAKGSFLHSRNRLWFSPASAAGFYVSNASGGRRDRPLYRHRMPALG